MRILSEVYDTPGGGRFYEFMRALRACAEGPRRWEQDARRLLRFADREDLLRPVGAGGMIYYLQEELFSFDHFDIWDRAGQRLLSGRPRVPDVGQNAPRPGRAGPPLRHGTSRPILDPLLLRTGDGRGYAGTRPPFFTLFPQLFHRFTRLEVEGDFFGVDYAITKGSQTVARMEKAWPAFHDRYRLEIADPGRTR